MGYIHTVNITDNGAYLIEPILFATTTGTAAALAATITNFELITGVNITLKITTTNTDNATLSINSGAVKPIYYNGNTIASGALREDHTYSLVYDGSAWQLIGDIENATYSSHIANNDIHITAAERTQWNSLGFSKDGETLVLTGSSGSSTLPSYATGVDF